MAKQLWASASPDAWTDVAGRLPLMLAQHQPAKLQQLNRWLEQELPAAIASRSPRRHITQPELVQLMDWKLSRGKWRPRLLDYAKAARESDVQEASAKACALLQADAGSSDSSGRPHAAPPSLKAALEALTVLKGVGPATASALLAAVCNRCPFMSDEALEAAVGSRSYTVKEGLQLAEALNSKAAWLSTHDTGTGWSAVLVERCLYAVQLAAAKGEPAAAAAAAKAAAKPAAGGKQQKAERAGSSNKAAAAGSDASNGEARGGKHARRSANGAAC